MVQINNLPYIPVRVRFRKVGDLQYISHLDLVRTMQRVAARAKLPLWYTEGFNPKPKMVFGPPLSTGVESECEFLDLRFTERVDFEDVKRRLNENLTDSMKVYDIYIPESSLSDIFYFRYRISLKCDEGAEYAVEKIREFLEREEINILKKSKKGEITVNIRPLVRVHSLSTDGDLAILDLVLDGSQTSFLNPENLVKAIKENTDLLPEQRFATEYYTVMKLDAYREDMSRFN